jgi:hypothetical protein
MFNPQEKANLYTDTLTDQFSCSPGCPITVEEFADTIKSLNSHEVTRIKPFSPGKIN